MTVHNTWLTWQCGACLSEQVIHQPEARLKIPTRCSKGCRNQKNFIPLRSSKTTICVDRQMIRIQEIDDQVSELQFQPIRTKCNAFTLKNKINKVNVFTWLFIFWRRVVVYQGLLTLSYWRICVTRWCQEILSKSMELSRLLPEMRVSNITKNNLNTFSI